MQQMQEVSADGRIIGFKVNPPSMMGEVVPVEQHGA
jgi:hypothetical protein